MNGQKSGILRSALSAVVFILLVSGRAYSFEGFHYQPGVKKISPTFSEWGLTFHTGTSRLNGTDISPVVDSRYTFGFGAYINFQFSPMAGIQLETNFIQKNSRETHQIEVSEWIHARYTLRYDVPVYSNWSFQMLDIPILLRVGETPFLKTRTYNRSGDFTLHWLFGPVFSFVINRDIDLDDSHYLDRMDEHLTIEHPQTGMVSVGLVIGADGSFNFTNNSLTLGLRYSTAIAGIDYSEADIGTEMFVFMIGYGFSFH